uniref:Uncharacterized protein n=1 Tax=Geladintestivirus 6 TaxID=3233138 RepID=A0AAU8MHQ8_9CAUD
MIYIHKSSIFVSSKVKQITNINLKVKLWL